MDHVSQPTIRPHPGFNASADGDALRTAMKGFGTDEQAIIDILCSRSNSQRQLIKQYFAQELGRDLVDDLKSDLGGKFEDLILALMMSPDEYLCQQLNNAMHRLGTKEEALVEILCTKSNEEVRKLVTTYEEMFNRPLAEHMCSETSGHFRRLLTLIITGVRDPVGKIDKQQAKADAAAMYDAGEGKLGTDEEVFNRILAHGSFAQLRVVFEEYKNLSGMTIEQALKHEMHGSMHEAMSAIVECVQSPPAFFATRLSRAMDGAGTDDVSLVRIIVSRSEIDLENIKQEFERIYDKTLYSAIKNETSGDYKNALCTIIGEA